MKWITGYISARSGIKGWVYGFWVRLANGGLVNIRMWPWSTGRSWSAFLFHHVDGCLCGWTHQHQDAGRTTGACVMLWAMFCWEPLGPALHVGVTLTGTTYPSFVADHHAPWWLWPCHKAKNASRAQPVWGVDSASKFPRSESNPASVGGAAKTCGAMKVPPQNLQDLKDVLLTSLCQIPEITAAHLQGSGGVHASMDQGCFSSQTGTDTGRWP